MLDENTIQRYMQSLECSREEAIQLIQDDLSDTMTEEQKELETKAKAMKRRYEKSDTPRKKVVKERKIDTVKKTLLDIVLDALQDTVKITNILNELSADFEYCGEEYTIKITRHRKKK